MDWDISFSRQVVKFLASNHLGDAAVTEPVTKAVRKLSGEQVPVDIKKLSGDWEGYVRVRTGQKRIIFSVDFLRKRIVVEVFDYRGSVYR